MTARDGDDAPRWDAGTFRDAVAAWLEEHGQRIAQNEIGRAALGRGVTPEDVVAATMLSLMETAERNGVPVDPSHADAVAAYTCRTLHHRVIDQCRAATRRKDQVKWIDETSDPREAGLADDPVERTLHQLLLECVRRVLSPRCTEPTRDAVFAVIAMAALSYLETRVPDDVPQPQVKGTAWTCAGWAALHSVDRQTYFPSDGLVAPNTLTQRRRTALDRAQRLLQDAMTECGGGLA